MRRLYFHAAFALFISCFAVEAGTAFKQGFTVVPVAKNITAFIANESNSGVVQGNIVMIEGDDSLLVIDSGQFPGIAEQVIDEIHKISSKPVKILVNTHWHGDHLLANYVFREKYPGVLVLQHEETARMCRKYYADWDKKKMEMRALVVKLREVLKSGKHTDGRPLTDTERQGYPIDADALEDNLTDIELSRYTPADSTYMGTVTFYLGKREVRVMNLGWGNTAGDTIVFVPDENVLITGDTVVYPTPYSFGSFHGSWIQVLNKMIAMNPAKIVPGHGPVMQDASYLKTLVALLEETRAQVQAAVKDGLSLEETRKKVTLDQWSQRLAGDVDYRRRAFRDFYVDPGIEVAYKEAKGEKIEE